MQTFHSQHLSKTYGAFLPNENEKVIGYVTLVCGKVSAPGVVPVSDEMADYTYQSYPAVKIARLAVDQRHRGIGLGVKLVDLSIGIAKTEVCPAVGCRFAVLDAKKQTVDFYLKYGFSMLNTPDNKKRAMPVMFIDLWNASQSPALSVV